MLCQQVKTIIMFTYNVGLRLWQTCLVLFVDLIVDITLLADDAEDHVRGGSTHSRPGGTSYSCNYYALVC